MSNIQKNDIVEAINQVIEDDPEHSVKFFEAVEIVTENLLKAIRVCDRNIISTLNSLSHACEVCTEKCLICILDTLYEQSLIDFKTVDTLTKAIEDIQKLEYINKTRIKTKKDVLDNTNFSETEEILRDLVESNYDC